MCNAWCILDLTFDLAVVTYKILSETIRSRKLILVRDTDLELSVCNVMK